MDTMRRATILIVDDDTELAEGYAEYLGRLGALVLMANSAREMSWKLSETQIDLIVLDLNMPGEGGLSALRRVRDAGPIPVLVLTGIADPIERMVGLELGADDFLVKPIDPRELAARIGRILGRSGLSPRELVLFERVTADLTASCLLRPGRLPERLSPGEVLLIRTFAAAAGQVLSREDLLEKAPAESAEAFDRAIDTRIARLRQKLATDTIVTVRGKGYMFLPATPADEGDRPAS
jgi:DNA-binding response OmpR family regulator